MLKQTTFAIFLIAMLSGCTYTRTNEAEASPAFLKAQGWQNPSRFLVHRNFEDYSESIRSELQLHRIPFAEATAELEIEMASPVEQLPTAHCGGRTAGIAILVHGLSDTAYTMRDVAGVLADSCYVSRSILLPGHGTRAGDISTTRFKHWSDTLDYLVRQAANETDNILLVGFSLGAVLTLEQAISNSDDIDGVIALSPAFNLSSYRVAKWSRWLRPFVPWIDRGISDDSMRYEAMPTRGVVETVNAIKSLNRKLEKTDSIDVPWLLAQSLDDAVIVPEKNQQLWEQYAVHPASRLVRFYSGEVPPEQARVINISGRDEQQKVLGLSHVAIHNGPSNEHYGRNGRYRNCGVTAPRDRTRVAACEQADSVWYGLWSSETEIEDPMAISTFNPAFDVFAVELRTFASKVTELVAQNAPIEQARLP